MQYTLILHPAEECGYWAEVPSLSGYFSQGETVEETIENNKEAIESHLIVLQAEGRQPSKNQLIYLLNNKIEITAVTKHYHK